MQIHVLQNEQQTGPYSEADVRTMIGSGQLSPDDLMWREGMAGWQPIGSVLAGVLDGPAAPPAPVALTRGNFFAGGGLSALGGGRAAPAPGIAQVTEKKSTAAQISLVLGILSLVLFLCAGGILGLAAVIAGLVALRNIGQPDSLYRGRARAWIGVATGSLSMVLGTALLVFGILVEGEEGAGAVAGPLQQAKSAILSDSSGEIGHGNTEQAKQLADEYALRIKALQEVAFTRAGGDSKPRFSLSGGNFLTWCQLSENRCAFLVHVPELRNYKQAAKETLHGLCWMVAQQVLAEEGWPDSSGLAVGIRGTFLFDRILIGSYAGDYAPDDEEDLLQFVRNADATEDDLEIFFPLSSVAPSAVEGGETSREEIRGQDGSPVPSTAPPPSPDQT